MAGMTHSDCRWTCGCAGKSVRALGNTCRTWARLRWWFTKRHSIKCTYLYLYLWEMAQHTPCTAWSADTEWSFRISCIRELTRIAPETSSSFLPRDQKSISTHGKLRRNPTTIFRVILRLTHRQSEPPSVLGAVCKVCSVSCRPGAVLRGACRCPPFKSLLLWPIQMKFTTLIFWQIYMLLHH